MSLCGNLGILAVFKYSDFFVENLAGFLRLVGVSEWHPRPLGIVLPLGISFYTFPEPRLHHRLYRRDVRPIDSFLVFSVFVMFFPHLIAGPILRAKEFSPQLQTPRWVDNERIVRGISRIAIGLTKKVLIADWLASVVEPVFANPAYFDGRAHLVALYAYAFQILFDFAGYCDIAIGCALLLGYELPENFNSPYLSRSVTEFWRRWHITLSTWLRDYLYISLGGNRFGSWRTYRNLALTMLLGGLWHGASWNFVIWGGLHGIYLAVHRAWNRDGDPAQGSKLRHALKVVVTFNLVCFAWIFFRAQHFDQAWGIMHGIARFAATANGMLWLAFASPSALAAYWVLSRMRQRFEVWVPHGLAAHAGYGGILGLLLLGLTLAAAPGAEFIYFQF
ncbi:MAG: MBOAT family protein [Myxococcales bacterium]|nr:MBOAT family protein [Myxococcales bacterium]